MKILSIILFLIGFINFSNSQHAVRTTISSGDFRFGGSMTEEIFEKLNSDEQRAYLIALDSLGLTKDSISWADSEFISQLASDENICSQKNLWINTKEFNAEIDIIRQAKNHLVEPKYMLFFKREKQISYYTFQVYF